MSEIDPLSRPSGADGHYRQHDKHTRRRDSRSRSPRREQRTKRCSPSRSRGDNSRRSQRARPSEPICLPPGVKPLSKHDLEHYEPLLGMYLDIQKAIGVEDLDRRELKGRWKSFVGKWNRGELAAGWYDPDTLEKARGSAHSSKPISSSSPGRTRQVSDSRSFSPADDRRARRGSSGRLASAERPEDAGLEEDAEEDEAYGPQLPSTALSKRPEGKSGPTIPNLQDLQLRREEERSALEASRQAQHTSRKHARHAHKSEQRDIEDEVAPRAEAGTRERQLEKRREVAASNRAFAESRRGGSPGAAVPDAELMGGGDGKEDLEALKKAKEKEQRKKNEREIRKEEMLRARAVEREERLQSYRRKEEETMGFLRSLAKQRFG